MSLHELLVARIRREYREMPGLRLTAAQACRLWQVDAATCQGVLQTLLTEGFLVRMANGLFMALPTLDGGSFVAPEKFGVNRAPAATSIAECVIR